MYVLDTSAILSGKFFEGKLAITPSVYHEVKKGGIAWKNLQYMKAAGLQILAPPAAAIKLVEKSADKTGDLPKLSKADIETIALAFHLGAILLTDDYSMQNVAEEMNIKYMGIMEDGIKEKFYWTYRCSSCGKYYKNYIERCDICGGKIKRVRKRLI